MSNKHDPWSSKEYQHSASFVPELATKVFSWLDPQPDDIILDIGCGDGVLSVNIAEIFARGAGKLVGIDLSPAMIEAARKLAQAKNIPPDNYSFDVIDATNITQSLLGAKENFSKIFSNAAFHWILKPENTRRKVFEDIHDLLVPGGRLVFECGGRGNISEVRAAMTAVLSRHVGFEAARAGCPWFFPDLEWVQSVLTQEAGWDIEKSELEYRPTRTTKEGIEGWLRIMGYHWFSIVRTDMGEGIEARDNAIREVTRVLEEVCQDPRGVDWHLGYVRLRVVARKK